LGRPPEYAGAGAEAFKKRAPTMPSKKAPPRKMIGSRRAKFSASSTSWPTLLVIT
jgi:hypothetical protein